MVSRIIRIISLTLSMLLAVCCMTGCFGKMIVQDEEHAELPDVDPEDGVEKTVAVKLYYRLTNEEYLAGVESSVTVRAGERTETAVIRARANRRRAAARVKRQRAVPERYFHREYIL